MQSSKPQFQFGLSERSVKEISNLKNEPDWMLQYRLEAYENFSKKKIPEWGPELSSIDFSKIVLYTKSTDRVAKSWNDVPKHIRDTYKKLGIPQAEQEFFAGVGAQYDSEMVYHNLDKKLEDQGVIFLDTDTALKKYPDLLHKFFSTVVPIDDNIFASLNTAFWSGGSFIYVPKGVKVDIPLQAYFRINTKNIGQFERTLIIADEGSRVHYIEGCTAPVYSTASVHAAVVEVIAMPYSHVRYSTVQNWSKNIYNLVTKRARAEEGALVEWVDGNIGSGVTMKYPSVILAGTGARMDMLSVALAGRGQIQDTGAKAVHLAPETVSNIVSRSVSFHGGTSSYRGMIKIIPKAKNSRASVKCDALILDEYSQANTFPAMDIFEKDVRVEHEARVSKVGEHEMLYLQSRGFSQTEAISLLVSGFMEPFAKELPMDYAVELNRLIQMEMEGSVG